MGYKTLAQFTRRIVCLDGIRCYRFNNVRFCETSDVDRIKHYMTARFGKFDDAVTTLRQGSDGAEALIDGQG